MIPAILVLAPIAMAILGALSVLICRHDDKRQQGIDAENPSLVVTAEQEMPPAEDVAATA